LNKRPLLAVDAIVITKDYHFVFVKRKNPPFKGMLALPGGFVEYGETVEEAVVREVKEETGLKVKIEELLGVYSDADRDPRGHVVSIVTICKEVGGKLKAGSDASEVKALKEIPKKLAFDHNKILKDAGY
jgi:8-oxo-dGTP diphosphatase